MIRRSVLRPCPQARRGLAARSTFTAQVDNMSTSSPPRRHTYAINKPAGCHEGWRSFRWGYLDISESEAELDRWQQHGVAPG